MSNGESTYLDSGFGQTGLGSQPFASAHARVMALVELLFQFIKLVRAERGPIAPELWLLGTAAAAHAFHVVFATVDASGFTYVDEWKRPKINITLHR